MANTQIQIKFSTNSGNTPASLANGEIAINSADGKLFYAAPNGQIKFISTDTATQPGGLNTEIQFNDSGSFGGSANLTFNKTSGLLTSAGIKSNSYYDIVDVVRQYSATVNTSSNVQTTLTSYSANSFCSGKFVVQATRGTERQATELLVLHDGTTAHAVEYAIIRSNTNLFNVDVDISSFNVRVLVTSTSSVNTTYKAFVSLIAS